MRKSLEAWLLLILALVCLFAFFKTRNPPSASPTSNLGKTNAIAFAEPAKSETGSFTADEVQSAKQQGTLAESSRSEEMGSRSEHLRPKEQPILMPLVFQNLDLAQLKLNPDQLEAIEDLRRRFLDEIGGLQQDPTNPAYLERWVRSQPEIDNDLRGILGLSTFQEYQIKTADLGGESQRNGRNLQ